MIEITNTPSFLCTWNSCEIVEVHTLESLKDVYGGTGLFDTDNKFPEGWSSNDRFHKDYNYFTEVLNYLTSDDSELLPMCHITYTCDNMTIQRIK